MSGVGLVVVENALVAFAFALMFAMLLLLVWLVKHGLKERKVIQKRWHSMLSGGEWGKPNNEKNSEHGKFVANISGWQRNKWSLLCLLFALCYCLSRHVFLGTEFGAFYAFMGHAGTYLVEVYALGIIFALGIGVLDSRRGVPGFNYPKLPWKAFGKYTHVISSEMMEQYRNSLLILVLLMAVFIDAMGLFSRETIPAITSDEFAGAAIFTYMFFCVAYILARIISPDHDFLVVKFVWMTVSLALALLLGYSLWSTNFIVKGDVLIFPLFAAITVFPVWFCIALIRKRGF